MDRAFFLRSRRQGFTLIEILIVIGIISLLSSLCLVAVKKAQEHTKVSIASNQVANLRQMLALYLQDEGDYPGIDSKPDPDRNDFPLLFNALCGTPRPKGPGGRGAPYVQLKEEDIAVVDRATGSYRKASRQELRDPNVEKYLLDSWENPYVYRANKGKEVKGYMHHAESADIYSIGRNEMDDTALEKENGDDLGNW